MTSTLRRTAAAVITAAATCLALAPAQAAAPAADTSATLTWTASVLKVKVDSPKASCERGRRVFIAVSGSPFSGAATGKTKDNGVFSYGDGGPPYGTLRAYVTRTAACRPAQSNAVTRDAEPARQAAQARTSARITRTADGYRVKVTSPKPGCEAGRKVTGFEYAPGNSFANALSGTTNANGVALLELELGAPRGDEPFTFRSTAFVRVTAACALGQSNTLTTVAPPV